MMYTLIFRQYSNSIIRVGHRKISRLSIIINTQGHRLTKSSNTNCDFTVDLNIVSSTIIRYNSNKSSVQKQKTSEQGKKLSPSVQNVYISQPGTFLIIYNSYHNLTISTIISESIMLIINQKPFRFLIMFLLMFLFFQL